MGDYSIDIVWERIADLEGSAFRQIRGQEFVYEIVGQALRPNTTNQNLPRSQFEKALEFLPLENTREIQHLRGPSYLYAILMDRRIRRDDEWGSRR